MLCAMPKRIGRGGRTGQTHSAAPCLRSYETPPASPVTVTRPDGTRETLPAQKPKPAPRKARRPQKRGPAVCAICGYPIRGEPEQSRERATRGKPIHPPGACQKAPGTPSRAAALPRSRNTTASGKQPIPREQWIKVTCPRCRAVPGTECTARGVALATPHSERVRLVRRVLDAALQQQDNPDR
jgi:hypothetical protein